jgi:ribonuclease D
MLKPELPDPIMIKEANALERLVRTLAHETILGVDTESNSLFVYQEQVCLIQISTREADYLVDPLRLRDLSALGTIFADPRIEKVFHAAEYDIMTLKRDFDFHFANLFDTMVAVRVLGRKNVGLGSILESEFGVRPDKRLQRANWGQRPLPRELLKYAQLDTHYLIPLRERLQAELKAADRLALAKEDFRRVCKVNGFGFNNGKSDGVWRISGSYDLQPQQAAILHELAAYREQMAQLLDRPLFKVINDQTLVDIALASPQNIEELSRIKGMSRGQVQRHGLALLEAVQRGLQAEPIFPPRMQRPDGAYLERIDKLRLWRKHTAHELGVESDVVLPRDLMNAIARHDPQDRSEMEEILAEVPWRLEQYGEEILGVVRGS